MQVVVGEDVAEGPEAKLVGVAIDAVQSAVASICKDHGGIRICTYTKKMIMIAAAISSSSKPAALDSVSSDFVNQAASDLRSKGSL